MKKILSIIFAFGLIVLVNTSLSYATGGACSGHGGVDCSAGPDDDGSVICSDGWNYSSVNYWQSDDCLLNLCNSQEDLLHSLLQEKYTELTLKNIPECAIENIGDLDQLGSCISVRSMRNESMYDAVVEDLNENRSLCYEDNDSGVANAHAVSLPEDSNRTFTDVGSGSQYAEAINAISEAGIVKGYDDGTYKPLKKINRAEFTKIIIEAKYPGKAQGTNCFNDVNDEWFAEYVCYARNRSIVKGNPDGTFRPGSEINTAEAYKIVFEAMLNDPNYDESGEWYDKYLEYAKVYDLDFSNNLEPLHAVTRGEMAQMIYLVLEYNKVGEYQEAILDLVNEARAEEDLDPLTYNKLLEKTAYLHAKDMYENDFFSHVSPSGTDPQERMKQYYEDRHWTFYQVGENIWEWEDPVSYNVEELTEEVMNGDSGWMQSPEHRANILNSKYQELGVGYYKAPSGKVFFVQNFGVIEFGR